MSIRNVKTDGGTWSVDTSSDDEDSAQWIQRYGADALVLAQRYSVASVMSAYAHLIDPGLSMKDATAALRRARSAVVQCDAPVETQTKEVQP